MFFFFLLKRIASLINVTPSPGSCDSAPVSTNGSVKDCPPDVPLVATMAPYLPILPSQSGLGPRKKNAEKKISNTKKVEILPGAFEPASYEKFLTFSLEDDSIENCDIFEVHRNIVKCLGREPKISQMGKGMLLIEVANAVESDKLKKLKEICGKKAECVPHNSFNHTRGVVYSRRLLGYTEEKLLEEFKKYNVINVKRIFKKENGVLLPQPLLILTFDLQKLPETISAAWLKLKIRPYVPSPRRCFYCQKYGHLNTLCRRKAKGDTEICVNCGQDAHGECCRAPSCVNCRGSHAASDKRCEQFIFEKEILTVRTKERITYFEAKQRVLKYFNPLHITYANKVKQPTKPVLNINLENQSQLNKRSRSDDSISPPLSKIQNMRSTQSKDSLTPSLSPEGLSSSSPTDGLSVSPSSKNFSHVELEPASSDHTGEKPSHPCNLSCKESEANPPDSSCHSGGFWADPSRPRGGSVVNPSDSSKRPQAGPPAKNDRPVSMETDKYDSDLPPKPPEIKSKCPSSNVTTKERKDDKTIPKNQRASGKPLVRRLSKARK